MFGISKNVSLPEVYGKCGMHINNKHFSKFLYVLNVKSKASYNSQYRYCKDVLKIRTTRVMDLM